MQAFADCNKSSKELQMPTLASKAAILLEWLPVYALIMAVIDAPMGQARAVAVTNTLKFVASKTPFQCDDDLVLLVQNIVLTEQGAALVTYLSELVKKSMEEASNGI